MSNTIRPSATQKYTVVEEGSSFKGTLTSSCPIHVHGRVEGELETPALTVSATGAVHGRAKVGAVRSQGELSGEFDADSIELAGSVKDNTVIRARSLEVKLASARGKLQVMFGECELAIGEAPSESDRVEPPIVKDEVSPLAAAIASVVQTDDEPLAAAPLPAEAAPVEASSVVEGAVATEPTVATDAAAAPDPGASAEAAAEEEDEDGAEGDDEDEDGAEGDVPVATTVTASARQLVGRGENVEVGAQRTDSALSRCVASRRSTPARNSSRAARA